MARSQAWAAASPEEVFEVLSDPDAYARWVVGSREIRDADPGFPGAGTKFHHTVGVWPLTIDDHTYVEAVDPPRHLRLRAKARPLGTAVITIDLRPERGGTTITLVEDPGDKLTALMFTPLMHLLVRMRNRYSLSRLVELAERGNGSSGARPEAA